MGRAGIPTGVHVLFERDGRVLLMRRAGTGFFDGFYSLPGGHVEEGESLRATAVREMREELGIDADHHAVGAVARLNGQHSAVRFEALPQPVKARAASVRGLERDLHARRAAHHRRECLASVHVDLPVNDRP